MKILFTALLLFLIACTQTETFTVEDTPSEQPTSPGLGELCKFNAEYNCRMFCEENENRQKCAAYCEEHPENEFCAQNIDFLRSEVHNNTTVTEEIIAHIEESVPELAEQDQRYTLPKNYSETVVIKEPLVLEGNDELIIEDAHYIIMNNIILKDNAQLIIRNAHIEHQKEYGFQYSLEAYGNSKVVVENIELSNQCTGSLNWNFFDSSSFEANNVQQKDCNIWTFYTNKATASVNRWNWFGGTTCDDARLLVENSRDLEIELCNTEGVDMDIELPVTIDEYEFSGRTVQGMKNSITLRNVTIDGWGVGARYGDSITIRNGHAVTISFGVGLPHKEKTVVFEDLGKKHYLDQTWNMEEGYVRLVNTTTYGWEMGAWAGNTLIIRNSNFTGPTLNGGDSIIRVENSTINNANAYESVEITLRDTIVLEDLIARDDSTIVLENTDVRGRTIEAGGRIIIQ